MTTLAEAALTDAERRALNRAVAELREELGDDLLAVWLYGSRARGDVHDESDIDLMVVARGADQDRVLDVFWQAAEAEDASPPHFSVHLETPESLADQRAIESFYIGAVERERIVLAGGEIPELEDLTERGRARHAAVSDVVKPRTRELIERSRERLRWLDDTERTSRQLAVVVAYYAMIYAARAALSEADVDARRHSGTWGAFGKAFVLSGKFDPVLAARGAKTQELREKVDYRAETLSEDQIDRALADARRFVAEVERMLGL